MTEGRKPPHKSVVAMRGDFQKSIVTQDVLKELETAQRVEWRASKRAALLSEKVKSALQHGATVEPGELYFDTDLEMVRSTHKKAGGE